VVVEQATWDPGWRVVDVAAGTALFAPAIAARVGSIVAVDLTPEMLKHFREPALALREIARVCRADRQLVLVDMVADAPRHWVLHWA